MASELSDSRRANGRGHDLLPLSGATEHTRAPEELSQDDLVSSDTEMTEDSGQDEESESGTVGTRNAYTTSSDVWHYYDLSSSDTGTDGEDHSGMVQMFRTDRQRRYYEENKPGQTEQSNDKLPTDRQMRYDEETSNRRKGKGGMKKRSSFGRKGKGGMKNTKRISGVREDETPMPAGLPIIHTIEDARQILKDNYDKILRGDVVATRTLRDPNVYPSEYSANKRAFLASHDTSPRLWQRIIQSPEWVVTTWAQTTLKESGIQQAMTLNQFWRMTDATDWKITNATRQAVLAAENYA